MGYVLQETMFGMTPLVLRRHYNGPGGHVPKSSGTTTSSVSSPEWCSVLGLCCVGGTRTVPQLVSQPITLSMSPTGIGFPLA